MKFRALLNLTVLSAALVVSAASYAASKADIVDTAVAAGSFNTLVTAVKAADLVDTLKGPGPFTVFAPNDAAFAKIPAADLQALLKDKAALGNVLTYHVVAGKVMASDVVKLTSAKTVQGQELKIAVKDGVVYVDGAKVISTDIETSNGVIHVIDSVVLPK
ncbi:MAG: fasciclin domain-containing protein [Pararheinheimera sp.]|nr:fasciclin domain-containing protein [Rheinheimera sp.]